MSEITDKHLELIKSFVGEGIKIERARIAEAISSSDKDSYSKEEVLALIGEEKN